MNYVNVTLETLKELVAQAEHVIKTEPEAYLPIIKIEVVFNYEAQDSDDSIKPTLLSSGIAQSDYALSHTSRKAKISKWLANFRKKPC